MEGKNTRVLSCVYSRMGKCPSSLVCNRFVVGLYYLNIDGLKKV